jgi:hypothetical protein
MELTASKGRSQQLAGVEITSGYFPVLGKAPFLGHDFSEADLHPGIRKATIGYCARRDRFQSDPAIIGKSINMTFFQTLANNGDIEVKGYDERRVLTWQLLIGHNARPLKAWKTDVAAHGFLKIPGCLLLRFLKT